MLDNARESPGEPQGMSVGELARATGVSTATINFYMNKGLLPRPVKTGQTRALYDPSCVGLIRRIHDLKARGLPLAVIARVLDSDNPAVELGLASAGSRRVRGPVRLEGFLEDTGLDRGTVSSLVEAGVLRPREPGARDEGLEFDRADLAAGRAVARLLAAGVGLSTVLRHAEYEPVTRAEAHFLAEHLAVASRADASPRRRAATRAAFATIRDYLRLRELQAAYPELASPGG